MSFHNVRDKYGRFAKKPVVAHPPKKEKPKKVYPEKKRIISFLLLDDTGSMAGKEPATIAGFNEVLISSKAEAVKNKLGFEQMLVKFAQVGHFVGVPKVEPLTLQTYRPSHGPTALWWATVEAIKLLEEKLKDEPTIGTRVVLTIFTDGDNNTAFDFLKIAKEMIEAKQQLGWVINFMGAGSDRQIKEAAGSVGIFASNTLAYQNNSVGTRDAFSKMSKAVSTYTSHVAAGQDSNFGFFAEE